MNRDEIAAVVKAFPEYQEDLFVRGYLLTTKQYPLSDFPFYGKWKVHTLLGGQYFLYVHPRQKSYLFEKDGRCLLLVGHAYNPFSMVADENQILQRLYACYCESMDAFLESIDELTGSFLLCLIQEKQLTAFTDCAGMLSAFYGEINHDLYLTSHFQLPADLCGLTRSDYVQKLIKYKFYPVYGAFLPGNLTAYDLLKRLVPNTYVTYQDGAFQITRFFPCKPSDSAPLPYEEVVERSAGILHANLKLIGQKWKKPAISLTGGMDSKTTLACANGLYDRFRYFSYISMPGEKIDADAAHTIAERIGVPHDVYRIPAEMPESRFTVVKAIIEHNCGDIGSANANDIRKRIYFKDTEAFDVEVKSWVSEIARANYYKKFGLHKMPPVLTPRQMTSMYKLFFWQRGLCRQTDRVFANYIKDVHFGQNQPEKYDQSDLYLWEFRYSAWGGIVITGEHQFSFDISIPYNNRKLLEIMLDAPLEDRIADKLHHDIIEHMNHNINDTGITITNYNETHKRMLFEKCYFYINNWLP